MLKAGDRVLIDGTAQAGTVNDVHTHDVVVRIEVPGGHEERRYGYEKLRLDPTMDEVSEFIDHEQVCEKLASPSRTRLFRRRLRC